MKTLLLTAALALATANAFAGVAPGCIGGCMGSAPNAGDTTLPAGYQCVTGWPNYAPVSCINIDNPDLGAGNPHPAEKPHHHKV